MMGHIDTVRIGFSFRLMFGWFWRDREILQSNGRQVVDCRFGHFTSSQRVELLPSEQVEEASCIHVVAGRISIKLVF